MLIKNLLRFFRPSELIMVGFDGNIRGYFVSPTEGYQESYLFSLDFIYPNGITAATMCG